MISRFLALSAFLLPLPAVAGDLMVDAWIPTAPPGAAANAAYVSLHNHGDMPRTIVGVSAEGFGMAHLHESKETDGVATMSMLHHIEIPEGGMLMMKPGGLHIMLMGPEKPIAEGDVVPLTLEFANGDSLSVDAVVKPRDPAS